MKVGLRLREKIFDRTEYKAVAIDLDGTMLYRSELSSKVERTLAKAAASGIEIVIATGRSLSSIPRSVLSLPFLRYAITSSGARVTGLRDGHTISLRPIDKGLAIEIIRAMRGRANSQFVMCEDTAIMSYKSLFFMRRHGPVVSKELLKDPTRTVSFTLSPTSALKRQKLPIEKINLYFEDVHQCDRARTELNSHFPVEAVTTMRHDIEVSAKGTNKAVGLETLCKYLSWTPEQFVAIGDSENDFEMLKIAGYSIAMGDADERIKQIVHRVAPSAREDGVAEIISELFLI